MGLFVDFSAARLGPVRGLELYQIALCNRILALIDSRFVVDFSCGCTSYLKAEPLEGEFIG